MWCCCCMNKEPSLVSVNYDPLPDAAAQKGKSKGNIFDAVVRNAAAPSTQPLQQTHAVTLASSVLATPPLVLAINGTPPIPIRKAHFPPKPKFPAPSVSIASGPNSAVSSILGTTVKPSTVTL